MSKRCQYCKKFIKKTEILCPKCDDKYYKETKKIWLKIAIVGILFIICFLLTSYFGLPAFFVNN